MKKRKRETGRNAKSKIEMVQENKRRNEKQYQLERIYEPKTRGELRKQKENVMCVINRSK